MEYEMTEWFPKTWAEIVETFGVDKAREIGELDNALSDLICELEDVGVHMGDSIDDYRAMLEEVFASPDATDEMIDMARQLFEMTER